jgi:RNA polymerase sigma factor (sigma-70 family)
MVVVEAATISAVEPLGVSGRSGEGAAAARLVQIFERHRATVLGLCRGLLRNEHEAEDAAQQTFLSAYRSLLNGVEPRHPAAWLATIARNECWRISERRMREPLYATEPPGQLPDPGAQAAVRADLQNLWSAIGELPRPQREALLLRELSGLSYSELAVRLDLSEPAVESLLFRARRQLRERLRVVSGSAAACVAPLAAFRDTLARLIGSLPDPSAASGQAGRLVAKVAAGAATVVAVSGTVAAVETTSLHRDLAPPADAAVAPAKPRDAAGPSVRAAPPHADAAVPAAEPPARHSLPKAVPALAPVQASRTAGDADEQAPAPSGRTVVPARPPTVPTPPTGAPPVTGAVAPEPASVPVLPAAPGAVEGTEEGPSTADPSTSEGGSGSGESGGEHQGGGESSGPGSAEELGSGSGSSGPGGGEGSSGSGSGSGELSEASKGDGGGSGGGDGGDHGGSGGGSGHGGADD